MDFHKAIERFVNESAPPTLIMCYACGTVQAVEETTLAVVEGRAEHRDHMTGLLIAKDITMAVATCRNCETPLSVWDMTNEQS